VVELEQAGVAMILYPLTAFRAMSKAAAAVYEAILKTGTQRGVLDTLQTREELYEVLDYHAYERKLDELFAAPAARRTAEPARPRRRTKTNGRRS
jgi:methylisocitrate lyase